MNPEIKNEAAARRQLGWYKDILKHWDMRHAGEKPNDLLLLTAHALGCRPGIQASSIAMALRTDGYTVSQYFVGTGAGSTSHNKRDLLKERGLIEVQKVGRPYSYKASLTEKGRLVLETFISKLNEQVEEEAVAKKPTKARVKAKKIEATPIASNENSAPAGTTSLR